MKQYVYVLKLVSRLQKEENWTEIDYKIIKKHFERLKNATEKGKVIMAGKTENEDETGFGIVLFLAENEQQATQFMEDDPAIQEGIMSASLFPFHLALMKT